LIQCIYVGPTKLRHKRALLSLRIVDLT